MQKNILVLNYEFPPLGGGGSPVSYDIAKHYILLGHNVDVVTMGFKDLPSFEKKDGINIYRVKCLRRKRQVCHPWEQLSYLISAYFQIKKLLREKKYDISHAHFIIPTGVLARYLKKKFDIPYIITAHGSDVLGHNPRFDRLYKMLEKPWKKVIDEAKYIISPSEYLAEKIKNLYGRDDKIIVIPNGIDAGKFIPMKKQKYILTVSRLVHAKGIQDLIEAVKYVDLVDWKIKIVGEGPMRGELEKLAQRYHLEDNIEFLGWMSNDSQEMKKLFGHASVFCQPSYFENASIVILEAMQAGCAILARNTGGNPETLPESQLFTDAKDLEEKLSDLIAHEKKLIQISVYNKQNIKNFEWDALVKEYEKRLF